MRLDDLISTHVGDTALDPTLVKGFLQTSPHYRQWGVNHQVDPHSLDQLNATDLFEFYLCLYLSGRHKTLQAVLREVRTFIDKDPQTAHYFIGYSLALTRQRLLSLEWYELLARLKIARERIVELAPEIDHPSRSLIVSVLNEFF